MVQEPFVGVPDRVGVGGRVAGARARRARAPQARRAPRAPRAPRAAAPAARRRAGAYYTHSPLHFLAIIA